MGSATNQALAETTAALAAARGVDLTVARELFVAAQDVADIGATNAVSMRELAG